MSKSKMKKFIGSIKKSSRSESRDRTDGTSPASVPQGDGPEAVVVREVIAFCEAGAPGSNSAGDEYLHLPAIVDAAESSPAAAKEAAMRVQRYLSKENFQKGYAQYNAIMLTRILTDNPGKAFTQNFDKPFVSTIKYLLRQGKDSNVQQILRETLDYIEAEKLPTNETLLPLIEMWRKEKGLSASMYQRGGPRRVQPGFQQGPHGNHSHSRGLPPADELAGRIEEAKTSARLLVQMVQSTPSSELLGNDLIKEFSERARQAHKSIQGYMACEPGPDEDTMLTLIETSEQLNIAMTKHQRAVLQARKEAGSAQTTPQPQQHSQDPFATTQMQNALPQQPLQPQVPARTQSPYGVVNPVPNQGGNFSPPSGPPPGKQSPYTATTAYAAPVGPPPHRGVELDSQPLSSQAPHTATQAYNVAENPFTDDAYAAPQRTSHSLFNRAAGNMKENSNHKPPANESYENPYQTEAPSAQARPGYGTTWGETPSFVNRQESATNNLTMHGASPEMK